MNPELTILTDDTNFKLMLFGSNTLYLAYFNEAEVDLKVIMDINEKGLGLVNNKPFFSVVNLRNVFGSISNEAKEFIANNEELNKLKLIEILIINNLAARILTKGYIRINKPKTKTVIVRDINDATELLAEYGANENSISELNGYLK